MSSIPIMIANRFFGLLTLVAVAVTAAAVGALVSRRVPAWAAQLALPFAASVATIATLGSLYYSEVVGYPPCTLCWYQRIAIYPQVLLLWAATFRRDLTVWVPSLLLAAAGVALSAWHVFIEWTPAFVGPCDPANPCTIRWVAEFGVLTIPAMAGVTSICIGLLMLVVRASSRPQS